jgi:hypothetical protein
MASGDVKGVIVQKAIWNMTQPPMVAAGWSVEAALCVTYHTLPSLSARCAYAATPIISWLADMPAAACSAHWSWARTAGMAPCASRWLCRRGAYSCLWSPM